MDQNIPGYYYSPKQNKSDNLNNLRSRGYPSSMEGYVVKSKPHIVENEPQHLIMNDAVPIDIENDYKEQYIRSKDRKRLNAAISLYNRLAKDKDKFPTIEKDNKEEFDDNDHLVRMINGIKFKSPQSGREGFLKADHRLKSTNYIGSINGLNKYLGDEPFQGHLGWGPLDVSGRYDGDAFLGTIKSPSVNYYYNALKLLLDRGTL